MDCPKPRFSVSVDCDLYEKINTFQHERRMKSQNQAITEILKVGIQTVYEQESQLSPGPETSDFQPEAIIPEQLARIIEIYNDMNSVGQEKLFEYAEDLSINTRYKKDHSISHQATG